MPIHDDEQFERYLKEFHPLAPAAVPAEKRRQSPLLRMIALAAAAAVVLGVVVLSISYRPDRTHLPHDAAHESGSEQLVNTQPLTIRAANALLATAPSFEAAVEEIAFPAKAIPLPKGEHSAIAELGKEKTKL